MFDFPASPTLNQLVTTTDGVTYKWDSTKWKSASVAASYVLRAGDTMTGPLVLSGAPTLPLHAATMAYADTKLTQAAADALYITPAAGDTRWVNVGGDTMTGALTVNNILTATSAQINGSDAFALNGGAGYGIMRCNNNWRHWWIGVNQTSGTFMLFDDSTPRTVATWDSAGNYTAGVGVYANGTVQSYVGRVLSSGSSNPSVCAFNGAGYADGFWTESSGTMSFGWCNGDGTPVDGRMTLDRSSNLSVNGGVYATYLQSSADARIANLYITGGLGINFTGVFNSGVWYAFGWDGTYLNYAINGGGQGQLLTVGQNDGRYVSRRNAYSLGHDYNAGWYRGANDTATWFYTPVSYTAACDERTKTNSAPTDVDALDVLLRVPVEQWVTKPEVIRWFQHNKDDATRKRLADDAHVRIGITAQRAREASTDLVFIADQSRPIEGKPRNSPLPDDMLQIAPLAFVPYLVRALQQLNDKVDALERRPTQ